MYSAINTAARNIYSFVRHANSGHSNYDAPDLMLYLIAMDSAYTYLSFLRRLVGTALINSPVNRYLPEVLMQGMGVDPADVRENLVQLRGYVNQYAVKLGSMCIPNSMSYMARHSWMTEGFYLDSPTTKAQTYFFTPRKLFVWDEGSTSNLSLTPLPAGTATVAQLMTYGQQILSGILRSEDFNIMSGDILKAFGADGVVKVVGVPDGYIVNPTYSQEVLSQIENATMVHTVRQTLSAGTTGLIEDDTTMWLSFKSKSATTSTPYLYPVQNLLSGNKLINMHHDGVTPEEIMVATRLTYSGYTYTISDSKLNQSGLDLVAITPDWLSSEVLIGCTMYTIGANGVSLGPATGEDVECHATIYTDSVQDIALAIRKLEHLVDFDWAPGTRPLIATRTADAINWTQGFECGDGRDIDNFTILSPQNLNDLADVALLSMLSVPQMGAFSKKL